VVTHRLFKAWELRSWNKNKLMLHIPPPLAILLSCASSEFDQSEDEFKQRQLEKDLVTIAANRPMTHHQVVDKSISFIRQVCACMPMW
jgi:hypothetical protein